jgi:hypothetical protein
MRIILVATCLAENAVRKLELREAKNRTDSGK